MTSMPHQTPHQGETRSFRWPPGKRAALSLSFDDAHPSQLDCALPVLDAHGVKATFYASLAALEKRLDDWQRALSNGHEIGNHTRSHPCTGNFKFITRGNALEEYTLERMDGDLTAVNAALQRLLGVTPSTFAYPCGQKFVGRGEHLQSYVPLVARHFLVGRGFRDESPNDPLFCDLAQAHGVDADGLPLEELQRWIEQAVAEGGWLIFVGHNAAPPAQAARQTISDQTLGALCRYARQENHSLWIDTVAAVGSYIHQAHENLT